MMNFRNALFAVTVAVVGAALFVGCSGQKASQPPSGGGQPSDEWKSGLNDDVVSALSQLSDTDRTVALAQKVCPVTDKTLGSMGTPPMVTVEGQDVFLCCGGCEEDLKKEPAKYLAKLNND